MRRSTPVKDTTRTPQNRWCTAARAWLMLMLIAFGMGELAWADWATNGFGGGAVKLSVWCGIDPTRFAPSAVAFDVGAFAATATIPGTVPRPAACNAGTTGFSNNRAGWRHDSVLNPLGGDSLHDGIDILYLVTPTSANASTSITVSGQVVNPTTAEFSVNWSGTDPGTAQRLRWYELSVSPIPGGGDSQNMPSLSSQGALLHEELRIGPWSEQVLIPITAGDVTNILLVGDAVATTVLEPAEPGPEPIPLDPSRR